LPATIESIWNRSSNSLEYIICLVMPANILHRPKCNPKWP
jgi:hypothetical protein